MHVAIPISQRYAISEQRGNSERKIRLIDDIMASAANSIITADDTNIPDTIGAFIAISPYFPS